MNRVPTTIVLTGIVLWFLPATASALVVKHVRPGGTLPDYATLAAAMNSITIVTDDINIVVHAGTYAGDFSVLWPTSKTSANHTVTIKRASGEAMPVFDGQGTNHHFLSLGDGTISRDVNFVIDGLKVINYRSAFQFSGGATGGGWIGNVTIKNSVLDGFHSITNVIQLEHCRSCKVEDNVIANFMVGGGGVHAVYLTGGVTEVSIRRNFLQNGNSDPFRFRDGCNNGVVERNYSDRVGIWNGVTGYRCPGPGHGEALSVQNTLLNNSFLYPNTTKAQFGYLLGTSMVSLDCNSSDPEPCSNCFLIDLNSTAYSRNNQAATQAITALAAADFDGDGTKEIVAAISADEGVTGRSIFRVVRSKLEQQYLGNLVFKANYTKITAMAAGRFGGPSSPPQLITAQKHVDTGETFIYRGTATGNLNDLNLIYDGTGTAYEVTAMTAGDYDGDGDDDVIIAMFNPTTNNVQVWRSQGTGQSLGTKIWEGNWRINALATGDFDGDGDVEVISARDYLGGSQLFAIDRGDGVAASTGLTNLGQLWSSTSQNPKGLAAGEYDAGPLGSGDEMIVAMTSVSTGETRVHRGDGTTLGTGPMNIDTNFYISSTYTIPVMLGADLIVGGADETITALGNPANTYSQISVGDGTSTLFTAFQAYRWPAF